LGLGIRTAFPWGEEGHQAIAEAAFSRLNTKAKTAVQAVLAKSSVTEIKDIKSAATWPDDIRISSHPGKLVNTTGAKSFNKRFSGNRVWHFVDFPLDGDYAKDTSFASDTDIVHILRNCIDVLEGCPKDNWNNMKKEEALAWLIHLAGDIHQPLHTGVGFYDFHGDSAILITDPAKAVGKFTDVGGNSLHFGSSGIFHSFWDVDMVKSISSKETAVITEIDSIIKAGGFANSGDYHNWPATWATETIKGAKEAYAGITDADNSVGQREAAHPQIIDIQFSTSDYKTQFGDLVRTQLGKGAFNLADLLNNIKWP